jgi:hypothetical protein
MYVPRLPLLLFLLAGSIAPRVIAVNLVVNPSFAGNMSGWTIQSASFDGAIDATGVPGSGSARVMTFVTTTPFIFTALSQCIAAGPGSYTLGGKILVRNQCGGACAHDGSIEVSYFSGTDCTTGLIGFGGAVAAGATGSFQTLSKSIVAPAGTTHILIKGDVDELFGSGRLTVYFDDFVLDNGASDIPAIELSGLLALILAVAAIGTFVLRR